ncbi:hypothetical protein R0V13_01780 [Facklamia hominis]|uniref:hypothetical protein n=1 Tax=Facklamia hominis TaxID=178214 RepID=UPI0029D41072|nr:hypothetical protein [Facklamia hominis]WPJ91128.1 hypothetical protein R0V13_01780 [Facklamia hominis]
MKKFKLKAQAVKALELGKRLISLKDLEAPEAIEQAPEGWVFGLADQSANKLVKQLSVDKIKALLGY